VVPPPCAGGEPKQYLQKQKLHKQTVLFLSFLSEFASPLQARAEELRRLWWAIA